MFATSINLAQKYDYLSTKFKKAYAWLSDNDIEKMADGRYDICDGVFAMVQRYKPLPFEEARFESHFEYFDIQYIASGVESFGMALVSDCELEEEDRSKDVAFYKTPKFYTMVNLKAKDFIVVPPEEAHQPRVRYQDETSEITKVLMLSITFKY